MQPVDESPGFAFDKEITDDPASLSPMTTVPALKLLPPFPVVPVKLAYVPTTGLPFSSIASVLGVMLRTLICPLCACIAGAGCIEGALRNSPGGFTRSSPVGCAVTMSWAPRVPLPRGRCHIQTAPAARKMPRRRPTPLAYLSTRGFIGFPQRGCGRGAVEGETAPRAHI